MVRLRRATKDAKFFRGFALACPAAFSGSCLPALTPHPGPLERAAFGAVQMCPHSGGPPAFAVRLFPLKSEEPHHLIPADGSNDAGASDPRHLIAKFLQQKPRLIIRHLVGVIRRAVTRCEAARFTRVQ